MRVGETNEISAYTNPNEAYEIDPEIAALSTEFRQRGPFEGFKSSGLASDWSEGMPTANNTLDNLSFSESYAGEDDELTDIDSIPNDDNLDKKQASDRKTGSADQRSNAKIRQPASSLMSILSGHQNSSKTKKATGHELREDKTPPVTKNLKEDFDISSQDSIPEPCDNALPEECQDAVQMEQDVSELEKLIYKDHVKSVSAKDFLSAQRAPTKTVHLKNVERAVLASDAANKSVPDYQLIEERILGQSNNRSVSAKDLFKSFKPKTTKNSKGKPSLIVTLKADSAKLKDIYSYDNPFTTRGNTSFIPSGNGSKTLLGTLMQRKDTKKVTLKVNPNSLQNVTQPLVDPQYTGASGNPNGQSANSFFKQMMNNATASRKLTPLQKLKELAPPNLTKEQLHIHASDDLTHGNQQLSMFDTRSRSLIPDVEHTDEPHMIPPYQKSETLSKLDKKHTIFKDVISLSDFIHANIPDLVTYEPLVRLFEKFIISGPRLASKTGLNWPQHFQPQCTKDLLISKDNQYHLRAWMQNAFETLKIQSYRTPRNVLLKKQKRQKKAAGEFMNFIVNDFEDELSEADDDIFLPLLIVTGPLGSGKSSAVYAALNEIDGYVHEVNAGQARGRKDIFNSLKELCTTQLVHAHQSAKSAEENREFQKGIVLFEDCDLLFEQDRGFWSVVQDIVYISKRPIVITCNDIETIPNPIRRLAMKEDAIIDLNQHSANFDRIVIEYLWLCCISQGLDVDSTLLNEIVSVSSSMKCYDVRKMLMACQLLCEQKVSTNEENLAVAHLKRNNDTSQQAASQNDLNELASNLELLSIADVLGSGSKSMINHEAQPNELIDTYWVDQSTLLTQPTLPFELNTGSELIPLVSGYQPSANVTKAHTFNQMREAVNVFIGSRTKKMPKLIQGLQASRSSTRSRTAGIPEYNPGITGLSEASICHHLPKSSYILDLAPHTRIWYTFQSVLDKAEIQQMQTSGQSIKAFLQWRQFQSEESPVTDYMIRFYTFE